MALVISLRQGEDFYVGEEQFVLEEVHSDQFFRLRQPSTGRGFEVSATKATEIVEDVFVSVGERQQALLSRVVVDAPRNIRVLRGDKYRNPPEHVLRSA